MNILMISIGDSILSNPMGDVIQRQEKYAQSLGYIDMIVFSPKQHNLDVKHFKNFTIYPTHSWGMLTFVYDVYKIAKKIIEKKQIDVITTQDPFGTALAGYFLKKRYNIPLHIQNHSSFLDNKLWIEEKPFLFRLFNRLSYFTLKQADRLRVVNTQEKQKYIDVLGINPDKIDVAPVPINIEFWQTRPSQKEINEFIRKYKIDTTKPILSWAGRMVKVKNLPYLFNVIFLIQKQQDINFLIAGDSKNSFWNLKELEKKYNIQPIYLPVLSHHELKILYYITTLYLHTSNYEGFGLVVAEAQACGSVVISRATAGTSDIIEDSKSGYLVLNDEEKFSKKILELLDNKDKLAGMQDYAFKMIASKFIKNQMFQNVVKSITDTQII